MKTKAQKRTEAEARQASYNDLTTEQKLLSIKAQPGKSKKQMRKLAARQPQAHKYQPDPIHGKQ